MYKCSAICWAHDERRSMMFHYSETVLANVVEKFTHSHRLIKSESKFFACIVTRVNRHASYELFTTHSRYKYIERSSVFMIVISTE